MTSDEPEASPLNPYQPPRELAEEASPSEAPPAIVVRKPRREPWLWVASGVIWLQSYYGIVGSLRVFQNGSIATGEGEGFTLNTTVLAISGVNFAIHLGVAIGLYFALFQYQAKWAGRVSLTLVGMAVVWCLLQWRGMEPESLLELIALFIRIILAGVLFRWYQQLTAWNQATKRKLARVLRQ
jgi:hypothetical protein